MLFVTYIILGVLCSDRIRSTILLFFHAVAACIYNNNHIKLALETNMEN